MISKEPFEVNLFVTIKKPMSWHMPDMVPMSLVAAVAPRTGKQIHQKWLQCF